MTNYTNQLNFVTRYVLDEAGRKFFETNALNQSMVYKRMQEEEEQWSGRRGPVMDYTMRTLVLIMAMSPIVAMLGCAVTVPSREHIIGETSTITIMRAVGTVFHAPSEAAKLSRLHRETPIPFGAVIETGHDSSVDLRIEDGFRIRLMPASRVVISAVQPVEGLRQVPAYQIELKTGWLLCLVTKPYAEMSAGVLADAYLAGFLEPGEFEVSFSGEVVVYKGKAVLMSTTAARHVTQFVEQGQTGSLRGGRIQDVRAEKHSAVKKAFAELRQE